VNRESGAFGVRRPGAALARRAMTRNFPGILQQSRSRFSQAKTKAQTGRRTPKSMPNFLHRYDPALNGPRLDVAHLRSFNSLHVISKRLASRARSPTRFPRSVHGYRRNPTQSTSLSGSEKLSLLEDNLLTLAKQYRWQLEAWAVFVNHYHFIARSHPDALPLAALLNQLHSDTARKLNQQDELSGREVWYNFWDTKLTFERSYLARLNYVHQNAVKHGLVYVANQYAWCSAAWFERTASLSAVKTIYSFKTDKLNIHDEY
jgi:putative transposase